MTEKYGVGLWAFGTLGDRFNTGGYKPELNLKQKISLVTQVIAVRGIELHYPTDFEQKQISDVKKLLQKFNLEISALCINFFTDPKWQKGSFSSCDSAIRNEVTEITKTAMDIAEKMGIGAITLWLGQDGYDYLFNDYDKAWNLLIEGLAEVAQYNEKLMVFLEYKHKEPRTHIYIGNVAKALYIIDEVRLKNLGVLIDVGHAHMADESFAESVALVCRRKIPFMMHFNDNYGF